MRSGDPDLLFLPFHQCMVVGHQSVDADGLFIITGIHQGFAKIEGRKGQYRLFRHGIRCPIGREQRVGCLIPVSFAHHLLNVDQLRPHAQCDGRIRAGVEPGGG